ncbi:MAG: PAS domain S-box protein, partial [Planctomycetota bacterium]
YREQGRADFERLVSTGALRVEQPAITKSGERLWVSVSATRLKDGQFLGYVSDITERKTKELQLQQERDFSQSVLDTAPVLIVLLRSDGTIEHVNAYFEKLTGCSIDDVRGKEWFETFLPQRDQPRIRSLFSQAVHQSVRNNRNPIVTCSGEERLIQWNSDPLTDHDGSNHGLLAIGLDVTEQTEIETHLKETQEDLELKSSALSKSISGVGIVDVTSNRLIYANDSFVRIWRYHSTEQIIGRSPLEFVKDPEYVQGVIELLLREGTWVGELTGIRGDGTLAEIEVFASTINDEQGQPVYIVATFHDVTQRKRAETALSENEEYLRVLINTVPAGVALFDRDLRYLACSQRWISDYGLEGQQVIGRTHYEVFPEIPERWKEIHRRCLTGVSERCEEDSFERLDGSTQYIRWSIEPWYTHNETVGGVAFFTEDITERVEAERALRVSEERLAEAQKVAHLGNWVWHIQTDSISWSDEVYRIFGHEPQSFIPRYERDFLVVVPLEDRDMVTRAVEHSLLSGTPYKVTHRIVRPDGTERIVNELGHVEYNSTGDPVRMFGVVHDVTESRRAEEQSAALRAQLAHASRVGTMGELTAGLAHELNQPLTSIHMYSYTAQVLLERLEEDKSAEPKLTEALSRIGEQSLRAGDIVRRMRSFVTLQSRYEKRCSVNELLTDVLTLLSNELKMARVNVQTELADPISDVIVDPIQIQQVMVNLIQNAIDAMSDPAVTNRRIVLQSREEVHDVVFAVIDSGPGLAQKQADHVFRAFETTKSGGMGLGLAICRTLIEAHRGTITAGTDSGGGASFEFRLPVAREGVLRSD